MATIGTSWTNVASQQVTVNAFSVTFYIDARYTSQDTANNTTTREVRLRSVVNSGSGSGSDYSFACTGCTSKSGSAVWYFGNETILSGSGTLTHNSDGTKSETLTATADCYIFSSAVTFSGTATYPTIARQSSVSISPSTLTIGSTTGTISISSGSSSFTHKIEILTGNTVRQTFTGISNSKSWVPSAATYNALIPNAKTVTATIRCTTYNGSTQVGSQTTTTCTLAVDTTTYAPTTNPTATGSPLYSSKILSGVTNVTIAGSVTIPTNSGATASSATIKVGNTTTALTLTNGSYTHTISNSTVSSAVVTVTDSRGVSGSKTVTWTMVPYVALTVTGSVSRADAISDTITLKYSGNYYTGSDYTNSLTVTAAYNTGTATTTTLSPTINTTKHTFSGSVSLSGFVYTNTYTITLTATDNVGSKTYTVTVPISAPIFSVGQRSGTNHFDVHGNLRVVQQSDPTQELLQTDQNGNVYSRKNVISGETTDTAEVNHTVRNSGGSLKMFSQASRRGLYAVDENGRANTILNITENNRVELYGANTSDDTLNHYLIGHNGSNLWIGTGATTSTHHYGGTYIDTGYDSANSKGHDTIKVSVPNASNTGATNYNVYHAGYCPPLSNEVFTSGIAVYSNRCTLTHGGYERGLGMCYVNLYITMNTSLSANNNWTLFTGFPVPLYETALTCAPGPSNTGSYSARIDANGSVMVCTGSTALSSGKIIIISGWYQTKSIYIRN